MIKSKRKLTLNPETIKHLESLSSVVGGGLNSQRPSCLNTCYTCEGATCPHC